MSKARIMGAGNAGSSIHNANVNLPTCGGSKKQGLPWSLDGVVSFNRRRILVQAVGNKRDVVFTLNQLGGVSSSSFGSSRHSYALGDGIRRQPPYRYPITRPIQVFVPICPPISISDIATSAENLIWTLNSDATILFCQELIIGAGINLIIPSNLTLTLYGKITNHGTLTNTGTLNINEMGILNNESDGTVLNGFESLLTPGTLNNAGTINNYSIYFLNYYTLSSVNNTGKFYNHTGSIIGNGAGAKIINQGEFTNHGSILVGGDELQSEIKNNPGGQFFNTKSIRILSNNIFINQGTLTNDNFGYEFRVDYNANFLNSGVTNNINSGFIYTIGTTTNVGSIYNNSNSLISVEDVGTFNNSGTLYSPALGGNCGIGTIQGIITNTGVINTAVDACP